MLHHIKSILQKFTEPQKSGEPDRDRELRVATAVLLTEVMAADHELHEQERHTIMHILQQQFGLNDKQAIDLLSYAEEQNKQAVSLHAYTSRINQLLGNAERVKLIENMWRVIHADGEVDKYEEHLIRRIAELLYVSHTDFIRSKHIALGQG